MTNYSGSKCPSCENKTFEMVEDAPYGSNYKFMYVRCMKCKTLITIVPYFDINARLTKLAKALNVNLDR